MVDPLGGVFVVEPLGFGEVAVLNGLEPSDGAVGLTNGGRAMPSKSNIACALETLLTAGWSARNSSGLPFAVASLICFIAVRMCFPDESYFPATKSTPALRTTPFIVFTIFFSSKVSSARTFGLKRSTNSRMLSKERGERISMILCFEVSGAHLAIW